jgi:hypothetical protein
MRLVEANSFEDALALCATCKSYTGAPSSQLMDIDVKNIHEKFGTVLYQKGDFDGAVVHYIAADSDITDVFALFPDLVPPNIMHALFPERNGSGSSLSGMAPSTSGHQRMTGTILHRAAAAVVQYCEKMRPKVHTYLYTSLKYCVELTMYVWMSWGVLDI